MLGNIFKEREIGNVWGHMMGEHRGQCDRCLGHSGINQFRLLQCGCTHRQDISGIEMSLDVY